MTSTARASVTTAVLLAALSLTGCRSKAPAFYDRTFPCDVAATEDVCGTTRDGQPMTCYSVSQLGGTDFCAPACDPNATSADGTVCLGAGARVETCQPSGTNPALSCPAGLSCYRTDLLQDEGLCLNMPVCKTSEDCPDQARRLCSGDLVRMEYPGVPLAVDNLHCLQAGCKKTGTNCPSGETCLAVAVPSNGVPDICTPNCDANMRCPPNFVCSRLVSGPAAPVVCVPGLPGSRCAGPQDCLAGTCEDAEVGFRICTVPCETDRNCAPLTSTRDAFYCVHRPSDGAGHCTAPNPFAGQPCLLKEHCPPELDCYLYGPFMTNDAGECRLPCGPAGECPARGGMPHVCLADGEGKPAGCYPGRFGLPCADTSQCLGTADGFTCETTTNVIAPGGPVTQKVCTIPCTVDADCDANPLTQRSGYCSRGFCVLGVANGQHCEREAHCRSRYCQLPPAGDGTCLAKPEP